MLNDFQNSVSIQIIAEHEIMLTSIPESHCDIKL